MSHTSCCVALTQEKPTNNKLNEKGKVWERKRNERRAICALRRAAESSRHAARKVHKSVARADAARISKNWEKPNLRIHIFFCVSSSHSIPVKFAMANLMTKQYLFFSLPLRDSARLNRIGLIHKRLSREARQFRQKRFARYCVPTTGAARAVSRLSLVSPAISHPKLKPRRKPLLRVLKV